MSKKNTKKQRQAVVYLLVFLAGMAAGALTFFITTSHPMRMQEWTEDTSKAQSNTYLRVARPKIKERLLTPNPYSRPQLELKKVNGVVIHYVANPGTSAEDNRNYFESLKDNQATSASSNFIVGLEGEIIQCVPLDEEAYCSNERNADTISIECCHPDESGKFNKKTYKAVVNLTAWLCTRYHLTSDQIIRHYDVTGKLCPLYYVENEDKWNAFKADVENYIAVHGEEESANDEK